MYCQFKIAITGYQWPIPYHIFSPPHAFFQHSEIQLVMWAGSPLTLKIAILEYHFPSHYPTNDPSPLTPPIPVPTFFIALFTRESGFVWFFYSVNMDCLTFHVKCKSYIFIDKDTYTFIHKLNHITVIWQVIPSVFMCFSAFFTLRCNLFLYIFSDF